eukprot:Plantae.Rhodophyta-Rhodochaete_pulchella.ctg32148.p1 GENE.Plantae.Rhodophyta-Rhodochaete_pulchella.ctg32148~~Plantae.Rhodophyta-Rhodochaete_pulchella.ctg32148.p1  ORF type:complete len:347 (-),score=42.73 Plantae.Rhodophyta-Rhodochaete_pulchella.ctg32148:106-1146(-)
MQGMIVSPLSPLGSRGPNVDKAATVFPSHVRRTFTRHPTDYTGDLVRLLDDIATQTHGISAYVAEHDETIAYGQVGRKAITASFATRLLYRALSHDGYSCVILARDNQEPLTFPEDVPHGPYVVCMSSLDLDPTFDVQPMCGTVFSIYKRLSSTSLPGRYMDLAQDAGKQVAAGFCIYASATSLFYTMGYGVHSFSLHPVAVQYFLQPNQRIEIPTGGTSLFASRKTVLQDAPLGKALSKLMTEKTWKLQDVGSFVANTYYMIKLGGVVVVEQADLLCEAAPLAFIIEQAGGTAYTIDGSKIMESTADDECHTMTSFIGGHSDAVTEILQALDAKPSEAPVEPPSA